MFPTFEHVPAYPLVFPVFWGAAGIFALAMARHLRVLAATRAPGPNPLAGVGLRLGGLLYYVLGQRKMFKDPRAGIMHASIFWGFLVLTIGSANAVTGGLVEGILAAPFDGVIWAVVEFFSNVVALVVIVAVGYAFWRRFVSRPPRLTYKADALIILAMIGGLVAGELIASIAEAARWGDVPGALLSNAAAGLARTASPGVLEGAYALGWWAHILLVSAFLVYLPWSKHLHIALSPFNVWFRKLAPRGVLPAMDLEREDVTFGVKTLEDLGWKDLLDGFTCTECGRCQEQCPATNTGKPLNPKAFIMGIRDMAVQAETGLNLIPNSPIVRETYGLDDTLHADVALGHPIIGDAISEDAVWDCVTCGACVEACPVLIEHVDKIVDLRRNLVLEESRFPTELTAAFRSMESAGNPWGQPRSTRTDWTKGLPFAVPTVAELAADGRLGELEVLYWVGCAAAFDERNRRVARAFATCLDAAGVRFAILGQEESCTGDPARRMGNEYVFQILATGNIETLDRYGLRTIVTACPHCFNSLGREYPALGGRYEVVHHSVYLARLLEEGRLRTTPAARAGAAAGEDGGEHRAPGSVTLHDACYLTRYNGVTAAPRTVLRAIEGLELREMERRGSKTFCCGAGGGRMWMEETRGTRINAERTSQALATGATTVATACPFCMTMLKDGLADSAADHDQEVVARDVAELLAEALSPARAGDRGLPVLQ